MNIVVFRCVTLVYSSSPFFLMSDGKREKFRARSFGE